MKKNLFAILVFLFGFTEIQSKPLVFSISGGQTLSYIAYKKMPTDPMTDDKYYLNDMMGLNDTYVRGNSASINLSYSPNQWIGGKTGLSFMQLGANRYTNHTLGYIDTFQHNYLGIPLELELLPEKIINFYGALLVNVRLNQNEAFTMRDEFNLNRIDIMYQYGIGLKIWKLKLKATRNKSLLPILSVKKEDHGKLNYFNDGFQFSLVVPIYTLKRNEK